MVLGLASAILLLLPLPSRPEPTNQEPTETIHLLPLLGASTAVRIPRAGPGWDPMDPGGPADQTRPSLLLKGGDTRQATVRVGRDAKLSLSLALTRPTKGPVTFEVKVAGRLILRDVLTDSDAWHPFRIGLGAEGDLPLEFRTTGNTGEGLLAVAAPRIDHSPGTRKRRVVIWISQDAVRADHLSLYGYARTTTPRFSARAGTYAVFDNAVAPASWTLASLASQFTSLYPSQHHAVLETTPRDARTKTVFEALSAAGFTVLGVCGNRFVGAEFHMTEGFDAVHYVPGRAQDVTAGVRRALEEWGGGDLALFVHYMDAHFPYEPPAPYNAVFDPLYSGAINGRNFFDNRNKLSPADVAHVRALYDGGIANSDAAIDGLLSGLGDLAAEALIVYSSDHGEGFLEHGRFLHAGTVYEELIHVPLSIRLPGAAPRRIRDIVSLIDLGPTILEAMGVGTPHEFHGRSLVGLLRGQPLAAVPVYSEIEVTNNNRYHKVAVRDGSMKVILKMDRNAPGAPPSQVECFDLRSDPMERNNLPLTPGRDRLLTLAEAYLADAAREPRSQEPRAQLPRDVEERLRALGYLH